ncbi:alpha/beta hydrolase [Pseudomaricurvus alkylphenolicus]|uniref:alpha/beta hydrolase n=1 Tax=Pseudomaricurvus alkylphenolicus TaxID=1306991 RepID=UPI00142495B4|nr:alpha/beta hydrolase [Pseudomaricurvus alkylphenolicus]NIB44645.1 alpha/beta hydrolase [Pseudomaricurvus alkylphenolicus]
MVKHLIDPELLVEPEAVMDFDLWADLPTSRVLFNKYLEARLADSPLLAHVPFKDHNIPGLEQDPEVRVRVYQPTNISNPAPAMLWIHGGGYVLGTIDLEVPLMQMMADGVGCTIVAVEYRLAPEHPFPAPLNDCYAALQWMTVNTEQLNIDPKRIAVGGVSAGAGLAAALALMVRDRGELELMFQLLFCPMLDDRNDQPSTHFELTGIAWDRDSNRKGWDAYLGDQKPENLPGYAVPSRVEDLSNLPPAYIGIGSLDLFLDENIDYARRLLEAGVAAELHVFPGGTHAFEFKVPGARVSRRAHTIYFDVLKQAFGLE